MSAAHPLPPAALDVHSGPRLFLFEFSAFPRRLAQRLSHLEGGGLIISFETCQSCRVADDPVRQRASKNREERGIQKSAFAKFGLKIARCAFYWGFKSFSASSNELLLIVSN